MSNRPAKSSDASSGGGAATGAAGPSSSSSKQPPTTSSSSSAPAAAVAGPALPPPPPPAKPQRTIQVKIGSQAPKTMTPDQAAEYLKTIAGKGGFGGAREVKMTFGSAAPTGGGGDVGGGGVGSASSSSAASVASSFLSATYSAAKGGSSSGGGSGGGAAVASAAGTGNATSAPPATVGGGGSATRRKANKDGMPCSEKEMKALMSMFVEIMGLQMNVDKLNAAKRTASDTNRNGGSGSGSSSGSSSGSEGSDPNSSETDSLPDLESATTASAASAATTTTATAVLPMPPFSASVAAAGAGSGGPAVVTGLAGIPAFEWEALERVAIEDALEQEERARKSHGKNSNGKDGAKAKSNSSSSSYPPFYPAAATYSTGAGRSGGGAGGGGTSYGSGASASAFAPPSDSAEAVAKKQHEKDVQAWKAQVVAAVQGSTVDKLKKCLSESPLRVDKSSADKAVLNQLIPYCVGSKNRKRKDSRDALTEFIAKLHPSSLVVEPTRNGRSVIHTLCYEADVALLGSVLPSIPDSDLAATCSDSGLTPLMYACLSGSVACLELLLANKADCRDVTNPTHTWQKDDVGLTCRQLLECLVSAKHCKAVESHGMALEEVRKKMEASREYVLSLDHMLARLRKIESSGYSPRSQPEIARDVAKIKARARDEEAVAQAKPKRASARDSDTSKSSANEDAKDASEGGEDESRQDTVTSSSVENASSSASKPSTRKDPVVAALLGMGFPEPEIMKGIRACGGLDRATADNVVAWIFGGQQESSETHSVEPASVASAPKSSSGERSPSRHATPKTQQKGRGKRQADSKQADAARKAEEERLAAEKLAAKREEQRRRNREWNNRAQVRQQQEDQAKISKVATTAGESAGASVQPISVGVTPPAGSYFPQPPAGPAAPPRLKKGAIGFSSAQASSHGLGNGPLLHSNDGATIASSIDVEFGNDDATVSTLGSLQTRATPIPFGSQPPKIASQIGPPGFSNQYQQPSEQRTLQPESMLGSTLLPLQPASLASMPPPGIPESDPLIMEARRLPSSAFSSHAFGLRQASLAESLTGASAKLVGTGILGSLHQTSAMTLGETSSLFSTGMLHHSPSPATSLPMPPGYGVSRMQSAPASFAPTSNRSSVESQLPPAGMSVHAPGLVGAVSMGSHVRSHPHGVVGFGLDVQHPLDRPQGVQQTIRHQTLDASIIDSISTGSTDLAASSLWGGHNPHGTTAIGGSSLLGSLISSSNSDSADPSSLFANPPVHQHAQQSQHLNEGLWGSSNSGFQNAQGGGSIW